MLTCLAILATATVSIGRHVCIHTSCRRYDRARCEVKYIKDMQLLGAMAPPGGGRNPFSQRILASFSMINMTQPNDAQLRRIFSTLLNSKLAEFADDVRPLGDPMVAASVELYRAVCKDLLPTPSKSHYLFNTRDLAKIILGVMQVGIALQLPAVRGAPCCNQTCLICCLLFRAACIPSSSLQAPLGFA